MATTDRTAPPRPGLGDREPGRGWWRDWVAPAQGLRPRPLDVLVALVIAFIQVAGTIDYSREEPSPWAFGAFAALPRDAIRRSAWRRAIPCTATTCTSAGPGIGLVLAVKGRPRVATATTTPFFDPQAMLLRA